MSVALVILVLVWEFASGGAVGLLPSNANVEQSAPTGGDTVATKVCPPLCKLGCAFGNVYEDGCPICKCNPAPKCPDGMTSNDFLRSCNSSMAQNDCGDAMGAMCWTKGSTTNLGTCCEPISECPRFLPFPGAECLPECASHDECRDGKRCCQTFCGKQCIPPRVHPRCPIGMQNAMFFRPCDNLNACESGATCWPRVGTSDSGVCCEPIDECRKFSPFSRTAECHHQCASHDECRDGEKCCQTGCGGQCVRITV